MLPCLIAGSPTQRLASHELSITPAPDRMDRFYRGVRAVARVRRRDACDLRLRLRLRRRLRVLFVRVVTAVRPNLGHLRDLQCLRLRFALAVILDRGRESFVADPVRGVCRARLEPAQQLVLAQRTSLEQRQRVRTRIASGSVSAQR